MGRKKRSLRRDHVIIYRLTAAHERNVRLREAGGETFGNAVGVGFGHILAVVHGEEFGLELAKRPVELLEERREAGVAAEKLSIEQREIFACMDDVAVVVRIELRHGYKGRWQRGHWGR